MPELRTGSRPLSALDDVRARLDALDRELVALLKERQALVREALAAKAGAPFLDPAREAQMMIARRAWAQEEGLDAECIEALFAQVLRATRPPT
jgi:hypothetical protein